jgi:hypothetical protein
MAITLYEISVPVFTKHLNGLIGCMKKTQAAYAEKKCDEATLIHYRFYPDMFSFARQVQMATNHTIAFTAPLAGIDPLKLEDTEKSLADLVARCEKTVGWLKAVKPEQLNGTEEKSVTVKRPAGDVQMKGLELLLNRTMPNFMFHCTTAYDIMRHNGIDIGKRDFMGA